MTSFPQHSTPQAPPVEPEPLIELAEPPKWPAVIGWISIVWGTLLIGCAGCGAAMPLMMTWMLGFPPDQLPPMTPPPALIACYVFGALLDVVLIVAGIAAVARHPATRAAHLVWAGLAVLMFPVAMYFQLEHQAIINQWINDNPDSKYAQMTGGGGGGAGQAIGQVIGWAIGIVFGLSWPVFCLTWFGLIKRRPADITGVPA